MGLLVRARSFCLSGAIALVTAALWPLSLAVTGLWALAGLAEGLAERRACWDVVAASGCLILGVWLGTASGAQQPMVVAASAAAVCVTALDLAGYVRARRSAARQIR